MQSGWVFNIQRYSVHDGPGIRTTVFLKGCPLSCSWCHNPESQSPRPEVMVMVDRCLTCGACHSACDAAGTLPPSEPLPRQVQGCMFCGSCIDACPTTARRMVGRTMSVEDVMTEVLRDRVFHETSAGGVTFSGGEPLSQPAFLKELLRASRRLGIHTAVDTCGFASSDVLLDLAPWTDLFLYDLKLMDDGRHRAFTGVPNDLILENLTQLDRVHGNLWIRIPLIPGVNDDPANLAAACRFIAGLANVQRVSLLPYHATAHAKALRLGRDHLPGSFPTPAPAQVEHAATQFRHLGIEVTIGA